MSEKITKRIAQATGVENLVDILSNDLSGADLHSLLLIVLKERISRNGPVTQICNLDGRLLKELEVIALDTASQFQAVDPSPLLPLGMVSSLTGLDQANVLSTIRAYECLSDPTIAMALETAQRRQKNKFDESAIKLCASQRVVRFPVPQKEGYTAHFSLFCLTSGYRRHKAPESQATHLVEQIDVYLNLLNQLKNTGKYFFKNIRVKVSDTEVVSAICSKYGVSRDVIKKTVRASDHKSAAMVLKKHNVDWPSFIRDPASELEFYELEKKCADRVSRLFDNVVSHLKLKHNDVEFLFDTKRLTGLSYYRGPCFHIEVETNDGESFMLSDGGFVDWTQVLLNDKKERLLTSAIGIELILRCFRV